MAHFEEGCKTDGKLGIGTEHEKFGLTSDGRPIDYEALAPVLQGFVDQFGWEPDYDGGRIMALVKDGAAITLEPGGQFELSGAITRTVHETAVELDTHFRKLKTISEPLGISWIGTGCHPVARVEDIPWMPKTRYELMVPFLGARGGLAHYMMKSTCTVQANFDYVSEADCGEMVHLIARTSPIVSAIFANSRLVDGGDSGYATYRCHIWTDTDPARCGTPAFMLEGPMRFEQYADYLLDMPVMFVRRNGGYIGVEGQTFRQLIDRGINGTAPSLGDWELHISTAFPDVRTKQYIEVRGADGGGRDAILGLPALWKGLLYDTEARGEADALIGAMTPETHAALYAGVCRSGFRAALGARTVGELATGLIEIAAKGLDRLALEDPSEAVYLAPLRRWVEEGSQGDAVLAEWKRVEGDDVALVEALKLF